MQELKQSSNYDTRPICKACGGSGKLIFEVATSGKLIKQVGDCFVCKNNGELKVTIGKSE